MDYVSPDWEAAYQKALAETDLTALTERVHFAEYAICRRWEELENVADPRAELERINQAVLGLLKIKTEKLQYPSMEISPSWPDTPLVPRTQGDDFRVHN